jgi:uncharacterized membrane protein
MDAWSVIRFLHIAAVAFFVGGQLMLTVAVTPVLRRHAAEEAMRAVARRFGMGSGIALTVLAGTGAAMAGRFHAWGDSMLQAKLALLALVLVLLALHVATPYTRALSLAVLATSGVIVYLGVELAHG